jgi:hypothetical protein
LQVFYKRDRGPGEGCPLRLSGSFWYLSALAQGWLVLAISSQSFGYLPSFYGRKAREYSHIYALRSTSLIEPSPPHLWALSALNTAQVSVFEPKSGRGTLSVK